MGTSNLYLPFFFCSDACVPAHPIPSAQAVCKPYNYGENGVCSSTIGNRLIYGSLQDQFKAERLLLKWRKARIPYQYILHNDDILERCLQTVELMYCNRFFQRCDNASSKILPVQICREACDAIAWQHCKEAFHRARIVNKVIEDFFKRGPSHVQLIKNVNCTELPRRNGGTIPECYYPRELEGI